MVTLSLAILSFQLDLDLAVDLTTIALPVPDSEGDQKTIRIHYSILSIMSYIQKLSSNYTCLSVPGGT
jgi:hypothetical protein